MISQRGFDLICKFEGLKLNAYPDPGTGNSPWTIGYGHTKGVKPGDVCTTEQAILWLKEDASIAEAQLNSILYVQLNQNQRDALISFVFNIGIGNLKKSTLLKYLNLGKFKEAGNEFYKWTKAAGKELSGLVKRRAAEAQLFKEPYETS